MKRNSLLLPLLIILIFLFNCGNIEKGSEIITIRVGHFPDIVHAQALAGRSLKTFEKAFGPNVKVEWKLFNAGPSAMEALFAGELDLSYIGPNPTLNGYLKSKGEALRIICGSASGGAGLVVRNDAGINSVDDFHGKRIASPQLGNTQDVALRRWLKNNGFTLTEEGGDVQVIPVKNPDQLTLFLKKEIDAAWTKEPWVSRLILEGKGKLFLDERELWPEGKFITAHLIARSKFLKEHRDLVKKWIRAHVELTDWITNHPEEAKVVINTEIRKITGKALPKDVLDEAFSRTLITYDPVKHSLFTSARWAYEAGFLGEQPPELSSIYELTMLNEVLREMNMPLLF